MLFILARTPDNGQNRALQWHLQLSWPSYPSVQQSSRLLSFSSNVLELYKLVRVAHRFIDTTTSVFWL